MASGSAPEGYQSGIAALLDLLRFGPGIWSASELLVLCFHVERGWGKNSDAHSLEQALSGIYSSARRGWVRGPAGVGKGTWERANDVLSRQGVITRRRHVNRYGRDAPSEYTVNWAVIASMIDRWKLDQVPQNLEVVPQAGGLNEAAPQKAAAAEAGPRGRPRPSALVPQSGALSTPQRGPVVPQRGVLPDTRIRVPQPGVHSHSQSQSLDFKVRHSPRAREVIAAAIEGSCGERARTDGIMTGILETGERLGMPVAVLVRFIYDFVYKKRGEGVSVNPGLIGKAVSEDLLAWSGKADNRRFIEMHVHEAALENQKQVQAMPEKLAETPTPEFADELLGDIMRRKGKGA